MHVDDIVAALIVDDYAPAGTAANRSGGQSSSLRAALNTLEGVDGNPRHVDVRPGEPNDVHGTWACVSVAMIAFGWSLSVGVANGLIGVA